MTVHVPLAFKRRGGRKQVVTPGGGEDGGEAGWAHAPARVDSTLVKALARAHRWQRMLEEGGYASVAELAAAERINPSYFARVLRLTLLAPAIIEAILNERHNPYQVMLDRLMRPFPPVWKEQHDKLQQAAVRPSRPSDPVPRLPEIGHHTAIL